MMLRKSTMDISGLELQGRKWSPCLEVSVWWLTVEGIAGPGGAEDLESEEQHSFPQGGCQLALPLCCPGPGRGGSMGHLGAGQGGWPWSHSNRKTSNCPGSSSKHSLPGSDPRGDGEGRGQMRRNNLICLNFNGSKKQKKSLRPLPMLEDRGKTGQWDMWRPCRLA